MRAVCGCGGRSEVLLDRRPFAQKAASAGEVASLEDRAAALAAAHVMRDRWVPQHLHCGHERGGFFVPTVLAQVLVEHALSGAQALGRGASPLSHVALVIRDAAGALTHVIAPFDEVPDEIVAGAQERREWIAGSLHMLRETARARGMTAVAAVALSVAMRRPRRFGAPLPPDATTAHDPRTEWQLIAMGVTPGFGAVLATSWGRYNELAQSLANPELERLTAPCDVLDGILARPQVWLPVAK